jgi:hypothetical protein
VEARGGVRPGTAEGRDRQVVGAAVGQGETARWCSALGIDKGSRESIHSSAGPLDATGRPRFAGYAPSEYQLKRWPNEAQSGAWCPPFGDEHVVGFEVESEARTSGPSRLAAGADPISPHARTEASAHQRFRGSAIARRKSAGGRVAA